MLYAFMLYELVYILFCETCCSLICKKCVIKNHKSHELEDITFDKVSEKQKEVSEQLERCSKDIKEGQRLAFIVKGQIQNPEQDF